MSWLSFSIVRHPQGGTAWLLINLGVMLITRHWFSVILGLVSMVLVYVDTLKADQYCIEKFGDAYKRYMERVPRVNFVAGIGIAAADLFDAAATLYEDVLAALEDGIAGQSEAEQIANMLRDAATLERQIGKVFLIKGESE